jgi:hypothetical protein
MRRLFLEALARMEAAFRRLEGQVPPPQWEQYRDGWRVRYRERTVAQAIIQKLARQISGLYALDLLLANGLAQEQGVMQRVLGDVDDDIQFLAHGLMAGELTPRHEAYLADFWAEEFDHPEPLKSTQKRKIVPRDKVHAHNARASAVDDPHTFKELSSTLQKTYSGFVHAASSHVMDMCGGDPPKFYFKIPPQDSQMRIQVDDAWNYFYRSLMVFGLAATALGDRPLFDEIYKYMKDFEEASGRTYDNEFRSAPRA